MIRQSRFMRFPEGKKRAITMSYDDGVDQDGTLVSMMKKYKMKGTFNISSGWLAEEGVVYPPDETHRRMSVSQCQKTYDESVCEVSAHGFTHPFTTSLEPAMMMNQIIEDRKKLERMFGKIVTGFAYPYGWYNGQFIEILKLAGIKYARTVNETNNFSAPQDWLAWNPTCHHDNPQLMSLLENFLQMDIDENPQIFYVWGHTFEFERNNNWDCIESFMKMAKGHEEVWYATNGEIVDYDTAYKQLFWSVEGNYVMNKSAIDIWVEVDKTIYKIKSGECKKIGEM